MQIWILAALCGWFPCCFWWCWWWPWWWWRWRWWWPYPWPRPPGDPDPPYRIDPRELTPEPLYRWWPMISGLSGAVGGILSWAILGDRFGGDGDFGSVALLSGLGGVVGLSFVNALGALRSPAVARSEQTKA